MTSETGYYEGSRIFNIHFYNLADLYYYLKGNPKVNVSVFSRQSSLSIDSSFYGDSLADSTEYLMGGYRRGFDNFVETNNELKRLGTPVIDSRTLKRSIYGGIPLAPLVAAEIPACRLTYDRSQPVRYVTIYFDLGYPASTDQSQIANRGLATLYIIRALEQKGYIVDFKAYSLSSFEDEIAKITIDLKRPGDLITDIEKLYFPMYAKEFFRRVIFRVMESIPFGNSWGSTYGRYCEKSLTQELLGAKEEDMLIQCPREMRIRGDNIYKDTIRLIEELGIEEEFDMNGLKELSKKMEKK